MQGARKDLPSTSFPEGKACVPLVAAPPPRPANPDSHGPGQGLGKYVPHPLTPPPDPSFFLSSCSCLPWCGWALAQCCSETPWSHLPNSSLSKLRSLDEKTNKGFDSVSGPWLQQLLPSPPHPHPGWDSPGQRANPWGSSVLVSCPL